MKLKPPTGEAFKRAIYNQHSRYLDRAQFEGGGYAHGFADHLADWAIAHPDEVADAVPNFWRHIAHSSWHQLANEQVAKEEQLTFKGEQLDGVITYADHTAPGGHRRIKTCHATLDQYIRHNELCWKKAEESVRKAEQRDQNIANLLMRANGDRSMLMSDLTERPQASTRVDPHQGVSP